MTTIRSLVTTALAALLALVPASAAFAQVPQPDPDRAASGATVIVPAADSGGIATWQVVSISALCALVAVLATLAVVRLISSHGHRGRLATA